MPYFEVLKYIVYHLNFIFGNTIFLFWTHHNLDIGNKNNLPNFQNDSPIIQILLKSDKCVIYPDSILNIAINKYSRTQLAAESVQREIEMIKTTLDQQLAN
jgi:hypothetical protein